eukprot:5488226-Prymnesium_polylepis.1
MDSTSCSSSGGRNSCIVDRESGAEELVEDRRAEQVDIQSRTSRLRTAHGLFRSFASPSVSVSVRAGV